MSFSLTKMNVVPYYPSMTKDNRQNGIDILSNHPTCLILRSVFKRFNAPIIIGIAGDSGSGKTVFSNGIRRLLGADIVKTIEMDGYHSENRKQREASGHLPLDPGVNNLTLLRDHLQLIRQGKSVDIPQYNHLTGDFDSPLHFTPSPIIILEGLHALYPEFLPFLDFTIYVDPCREIKWKWKYERDVKKRGHPVKRLMEEMIKREAAYKRWIDFQKTLATVVIKIFPSQMKQFARYDLSAHLPDYVYKVELIFEPAKLPLPSMPLPFDLANILDQNQPPFLLASAACKYWGRDLINVHIDGIFPQKTLAALEQHILSCTGIPVGQVMNDVEEIQSLNGQITATQFTQLCIVWRFLEEVNNRIADFHKRQKDLVSSSTHDEQPKSTL